MAVFRVEHTRNFTVMSNHHLRDKRLSLKAKGLLSLMLSLPEDWDYTLAGLASISLEGKDAIRGAVRELEQAGYVQRRQTMDEDGKFSRNEYIIRERPVSREPSAQGTSSAQPPSGNPPAGDTSADCAPSSKPAQLKKEQPNREKIRTDTPSTDSLPFPSSPPGEAERTERKEGKERKRKRGGEMSQREMDAYRELFRERIGYGALVGERPYDVARLDELVELMVEAACSKKPTLRVAGNEFPQAVVKSRLLKLDGEHIRFVFDCLQRNTTQVRNVKQYLLTVLYNAPATMENHYAAQVNHDLYGGAA